ncbi:glycosyltransferase involved in cell wall biosynthesis [Arthrobacter sp. 754]
MWPDSLASMGSISVVIPTRNDADMLASCLAMLKIQTRPADEIIVVDNSSTDHTAALCAAAGVRRIPVSLPGIAASTAAGFDAARSDIIARLDTDSRPPADWLQRIETTLDRTGPLSAVTGPAYFYGASRLVCWLGRSLYLGGFFWAVTLLMGHTPVFGSNFALRSDVWERLRHTVIRDNSLVHDDFDISYHLHPDMSVTYDPSLRVGVSARPFASLDSMRSRMAMTMETFREEFSAEPPLRRLAERRRWEREHRRQP